MSSSIKRYGIEITPKALVERCAYVATAERQFPGLVSQAIDAPMAPPDPDAFDSKAKLMQALRQYRMEQSTRALWLDLTGQLDVAQMGHRLSLIARQCLAISLAFAEREVAAQHGELIGVDGKPLHLTIIGMGKLGGDELNFNSDIDVVMSYQGPGQAAGRRKLDAGQYLGLVAQSLIAQLDTVTAQGRVWIVDTRLRPFGSTGALVWSLPAMEAYFLSEGRTWERYAWLKASHVAGDEHTAQALLETLNPFIYRRYLDYGIFESLRSLHQKIDGQSQRSDGLADIKRGPGGIRTLEFLVQSMQLLEGGRSPKLQQPGFLPALSALHALGFVDEPTTQSMQTAYGFLRTLENRLQAMTGRQTHRLPNPGPELDGLTELMGFANSVELTQALGEHRDRVAQAFHGRFLEPAQRSTPKFSWPPAEDLQQQLSAQGFGEDADKVAQSLHALDGRVAKKPLSREGRLRLDRFMPELIEQLTQYPNPSLGLDEILALVEKIAQRSAYLSLLHERREITTEVIKAFRASEKIARWVIDSPQLLDDLIDPQHRMMMPSAPEMISHDIETGLNQLGRWRQTSFLKIALAEINRSITTHQASQYLTEVAQTCIQVILKSLNPDAPLAVIAYGNTGAKTLHYASDLDLVFLHSNDQEAKDIAKIAQRLISMLQLPLPGGRLFEVDTRLRPNGQAGFLVSNMEQFRAYQLEKAWLWEHQALIRARWIAGDLSLQSAFERIRKDVLMQHRSIGETAQALQAMRAKQIEQRQETPIRKRLNDLQFVAEFGVLTQAINNEALVEQYSPDEQILELDGLNPALMTGLVDAWQALQESLHHQWLDRAPTPPDEEGLISTDEIIHQAWQALESVQS